MNKERDYGGISMVKRSAFPLSAALFIIAAVSMPASSLADGPYISLLVGGVYTEDTDVDDIEVEYDTGFAFAGQFGYNFDNFRLGGELGYQIADGESDNDVRSEVGITRFVITGAVDFPIAGNNGPFVGGGFGVANLRTGDDLSDDFEDEDTGVHLAWRGRRSRCSERSLLRCTDLSLPMGGYRHWRPVRAFGLPYFWCVTALFLLRRTP